MVVIFAVSIKSLTLKTKNRVKKMQY
jgi:hypothetical protein